MGNQRIDFHHVKEYAIQENNAVGPTTSLTLRTLDNTTPTNLNAVFLAMPGTTGASDAGANGSAATGTSTAPVQTLEKAIDVSQAQPLRNTIQIIRNGFVGPLTFNLTDDHTASALTTGTIIQAALGEMADINIQGLGFLFGVAIKSNGINYIVKPRTAGTDGRCFISSNTGSNRPKFSWCKWSLHSSMYGETVTGGFMVMTNGDLINNIFDLTNSGTTIFSQPIDLRYTTTGTFDIKNNLIYNFQGRNISGAPSAFSFNVSALFTCNFTHNTFFSNNGLFTLNLSSAPAGFNFLNKNSIFADNSVMFPFVVLGTSTISIQTSLLSNSVLPSYVLESGNFIGFDPLFFNRASNDFRLQDKRRKPSGSTEYFGFSSKGVYDLAIPQIPGDDTKDLGVYDVSYSLTQDDWESVEWDNEFWNDKLQVDFQLINYAGFTDLRGNYHRAFDAVRRKINFGMVSNNWTGTEKSYEMNRVIMASGVKRFYPNGDDGLFDDSGRTMTINSDGTGLITANTTPLLQPDSLNGFICFLTNNDHDYYLRIKSHYKDNTNNYLILEDHRRNQAPLASGTFDIRCLYLPIEVDQETTTMIFENWDPQNNPFMIPNQLCNQAVHWEGHIRQFVVRECEDDE